MKTAAGLFFLLAGIVPVAGAQAKPHGDDAFAQYLFPPELVMAHQAEISLTDQQRVAIQAAMQAASGKFFDAQFKLSAAAERFKQLIQGPVVNESQTLDQLDQVLALERDVKRAQIGLVVRIKNELTERQQAQLAKLRNPVSGGD